MPTLGATIHAAVFVSVGAAELPTFGNAVATTNCPAIHQPNDPAFECSLHAAEWETFHAT